MTVVDGYTRVSTDPQEENTSFEEQERCIREYCIENGLVLGMIHRETWSGYQYRERIPHPRPSQPKPDACRHSIRRMRALRYYLALRKREG